jgi:uncharacterized membrane protein YcaP (DUF421 family)
METVLRVAVVYVAIFIGLRVMGKREFSQLSPMELITLLLIPEIVSQSIVRDDFSLTNALVGVATLLALVLGTSYLQTANARAEKVISGDPTVLLYRGRLYEDNLMRERVTPDEVLGAVRTAGYVDLDAIEWAILEPDGRISVIPREGSRVQAVHRQDPDVT